MAMKLNAAEKQADSIIRSFNRQIERAYKELGYNHTTTQNLVNLAKSMYGASNMKEMQIKFGVSSGQINKETGEVYSIPQIARNRKVLQDTLKAKALKAQTQYRSGQFKGQYKSMYDVTKSHQRAINRAIQNIIRDTSKGMPAGLPATPQGQSEIKQQIKKQLTKEAIQKQIQYDDLASEIFAAYEDAKDADETDEDLEPYRDFATSYHNNQTIDIDTLDEIAKARQQTLINKALTDEQVEDMLNDSTLGAFLDTFEEILPL